MNEGQHAALVQEVMAMRMVLVHLLGQQSPAVLAAIANSIDSEPGLAMHPDVETALVPFRGKVDNLLVEATVVQRREP
jgi:hypothetical protein